MKTRNECWRAIVLGALLSSGAAAFAAESETIDQLWRPLGELDQKIWSLEQKQESAGKLAGFAFVRDFIGLSSFDESSAASVSRRRNILINGRPSSRLEAE